MEYQEGPKKEKNFAIKNLNKGNWITIVAGLILVISLFLPWFSRNTYTTYLEFSLTEVQEGSIDNAMQAIEPVSIPYSGADFITLIKFGPDLTSFILLTLITAIICILLCLPFILSQNITHHLISSWLQLFCSIVGFIPLFYTSSILEFFNQYSSQQYPNQPFRQSTFSYGIYIAWIACFGVLLGAIVTLRDIREKKRIDKLLHES
jgi:hypothetical protein